MWFHFHLYFLSHGKMYFKKLSQIQNHTPLIPTYRRQRQLDLCEFKAYMVHILGFKPGRHHIVKDPVAEKERKGKESLVFWSFEQHGSTSGALRTVITSCLTAWPLSILRCFCWKQRYSLSIISHSNLLQNSNNIQVLKHVNYFSLLQDLPLSGFYSM